MNKKIIFLCIIIAIIVVIMFFGFRGKNQNDNNNYTSFSDEVTFTSKSGGKTASNSLEIQEIKDKVSSYYSYSSDSSEMLKIVYGKKAKETTETTVEIDGRYLTYVLTDISWELFSKQVSKVFTNDMFERRNIEVKENANVFINQNGKVAVLKKINENSVYYVSNVKMVEKSDDKCKYYIVAGSNESSNVFEAVVEFSYVNDYYVISDATSLLTEKQIVNFAYSEKLINEKIVEEYRIDNIDVINDANIKQKYERRLGNLDRYIFAKITYSVKAKEKNIFLKNGGKEVGEWIESNNTYLIIDRVTRNIEFEELKF
ncbi:MAG: hypothetical protein IJ809_01960 [Clostridia bacterium]|nr:hypothetical protein [Clostridia bacterium]